MKYTTCLIGVLVLALGVAAQRIAHSSPQSSDFDRFRFMIISKKAGSILIYKSVYKHSLAHPPGVTNVPATASFIPSSDSRLDPWNPILESYICLYDSNMKEVEERRLSMPKEISGVHFIAYADHINLFYQFRRQHTVHCMGLRMDLEGHIAGSPVPIDSVTIVDTRYWLRAYTVINSEDRGRAMVFALTGNPGENTVLTTVSIDRDMHVLRRRIHPLSLPGTEYLSEFQLDNDGNLVFVGQSRALERNADDLAVLFRLGPDSDSLAYEYLITSKTYADDMRLLIDNTRHRYILGSFYSSYPSGNVEGLVIFVKDGTQPARKTFTVFPDSLRIALRSGERLPEVFNTWYLQGMHLREDGAFTVESQQLYRNGYPGVFNRWNYLSYGTEPETTDILLYDPYAPDHYWPWNGWRHLNTYTTFMSTAALVVSFDGDGQLQWMKTLRTPQGDSRRLAIGIKSIPDNGLLYVLFNENLRNRTFLTAQSISGAGELNTDSRLREDLAFDRQSSDYIYYPLLAQPVDAGEIVLPCRKGRQLCLALVRF